MMELAPSLFQADVASLAVGASLVGDGCYDVPAPEPPFHGLRLFAAITSHDALQAVGLHAHRWQSHALCEVGGYLCGCAIGGCAVAMAKRRACCAELSIISPELTRASNLSPEGELPPTTPPSAKAPLIIARAATTAATPAAMAAMLAGKGSFAPLAAALVMASPALAAVLVVVTAVLAAVTAVSAVVAALFACVAVVSMLTNCTMPCMPSATDMNPLMTPLMACHAFLFPSRASVMLCMPPLRLYASPSFLDVSHHLREAIGLPLGVDVELDGFHALAQLG